MRTSRELLVILALGCIIALVVWLLLPAPGLTKGKSKLTRSATSDSKTDAVSASRRAPEPVSLNRGPEVLDGFRGDVHPLLHGHTQLEVTAHWTKVGEGRDKLQTHVSREVYAWFTQLEPARPQQTYTERVFSAFLPLSVGDVGQLWSLDLDKMAEL